eukprot:6209298-Pleurochrysis_carterae.AAC.1
MSDACTVCVACKASHVDRYGGDASTFVSERKERCTASMRLLTPPQATALATALVSTPRSAPLGVPSQRTTGCSLPRGPVPDIHQSPRSYSGSANVKSC